MDLHVQAEHAQPRITAKEGNKAPKLPRPTLSEEISEGDWNFFCEQWKRYKRATKLSAEDVTDELWACLSDELARQCFDHGANMTTTTEKDLLALLKVYSIRSQNRLVSIVEYLNLTQRENENVTKFIARVRGCAKVCNFQVKCTAAGCNTKVSYADQLSSHVIVRGLENADIQEKVLALAATEDEDLSLQKITEYVIAQETAVQSRRILNEDPFEVNKVSRYQKQTEKPEGDKKNDLLVNEKCFYCGQCGHGYKASSGVRKELCPAYFKKCSKCNLMGHLTSECKRKQILAAAANALNVEERSSKASSDSEKEIGNFQYDADSDRSSNGEEFGWFSMTMVNGNKSQTNKKKPNYSRIAHHEVNPRDKLIKSCVEPQVNVKASALQRVLHQPTSQQMTGTPRTQWKEIDTVADTLRKLSLMNSNHQTQLHGGRVNRI